MSMTREEAISRIQDHMERHEIGEYPHVRLAEAFDLALTALRPVSREQVEKVWRGKWEKSIENGAEMYRCSRCGARDVKELYEYENHRLFCYHCGAPMTDEAVDMVMERLEKIKDGKID